MVGVPLSDQHVSEIEVFSYNITYAPDHTLRWDPPPNSKELAIALSYHFPLEPDLESKMRAAMVKFLSDRQPSSTSKGEAHRYLTPEDDEMAPVSSKPKRATKTKLLSPRQNQLKMVAWGPGNGPNGGFDKREVKRRRYQTEEGAKVARNRGYACERHRRQKLKCDPDTCPSNKQRLGNPRTQGNDQSLKPTFSMPNLEPDIFQSETLAIGTPTSFPDHAFPGKDTVWDDYSPLPFTADMGLQHTNDTSWNLPLNIPLADTTDMMIHDPSYMYDNAVGNTDILSFSWQGSSSLDPGIFFISSLPAADTLQTDDALSKATQGNLANNMLPTDFISCHSLVFPSDTATNSDLQHQKQTLTPGLFLAQEGCNRISIKPTSDHSAESKATPWYFCKTTEKENCLPEITVTIGTGDDARSTTFTNKSDFIIKLKELISHPHYYFSVPNLVHDPEQLTSYCRASYGKHRGRKLETLQDLPYVAVRR